MKLCPLGHENPDEATRCVVCYRELPDVAEQPEVGPTPVHSDGPENGPESGTENAWGDGHETQEMTTVLPRPGESGEERRQPVEPPVLPRPAATLAASVQPSGPLEARAGTTQRIRLQLLQRGGDRTTYRVTAGGKAASWVSPSPTQITLEPDTPTGLDLAVAVPQGAARGRHAVELRAEPGSGSDAPTTRAAVTVDVVDGSGGGGGGGHGLLWLVLVIVAALVGTFVLARLMADRGDDPAGNGGGNGGPTAAEALAMSADEARPRLEEIRTADEQRVAAARAQGGWFVQLSSKCPSFAEVDIIGSDGAIGVPDDVDEAYPGGVGENGVLAFHLGLRDHWGETVLLTTSAVLGRTPCPAETNWVSVDTRSGGGPFASPDAALCECAARNLPDGECAARSASGQDIVFWRKAQQPATCPVP